MRLAKVQRECKRLPRLTLQELQRIVGQQINNKTLDLADLTVDFQFGIAR